MRVLLSCPLRKAKVYLEVCLKKCDWYAKGKCPIQGEVKRKDEPERLQHL